MHTLRSHHVSSALVNLWRVNKYLIDMTAFLIEKSICYQQGLVRGTKDSDTLLKVPQSWLYGQRNRCWSQWSTRCSKQDSVLSTLESSRHLDLLFVLGLWVLWGCLLTGIAISSRTSHWFLWTNEIATIICPSITLFFFSSPSKREFVGNVDTEVIIGWWGAGWCSSCPSELLLQTSLCHLCLGYIARFFSEL